MLGTVSDAEDVVQDAWLRWQTVDPDQLERPEAWLTTVTTRIALDHIRSTRRRRETYVGPWLPEPLVSPDRAGRRRRAGRLASTGVSSTVLDQLKPVDRAVFLSGRRVLRALCRHRGHRGTSRRRPVVRSPAGLGGGSGNRSVDRDPDAERDHHRRAADRHRRRRHRRRCWSLGPGCGLRRRRRRGQAGRPTPGGRAPAGGQVVGQSGPPLHRRHRACDRPPSTPRSVP